MIKIYLITLSIILTTLTIIISVTKPEMSKQVKFSQNEVQVTMSEVARNPEATNKLPEHVKVENKDNISVKVIDKTVQVSTPKTQQTTKIVENKAQTSVKNIEVKKPVQSAKPVEKNITVPTSNVKTTEKTVQVAPPKAQEKVITTELPKSVKDILQNKQPEHVQEKQITVEQTQPQKTVEVVQKPVSLPKVESKPIEQMTPDEIIKQAEKEDRLLNEREEVVVWNVWRSNLQNQIMHDTQVSAPLGTVFKFSFTVDKKGRISNLKAWAQPSMYNSVAVNYLKPLIQSYQGKPILTFPSRTKRVITNVTGGFTISTEDKFSTPSDFSDIERIKTVR